MDDLFQYKHGSHAHITSAYRFRVSGVRVEGLQLMVESLKLIKSRTTNTAAALTSPTHVAFGCKDQAFQIDEAFQIDDESHHKHGSHSPNAIACGFSEFEFRMLN